MPFADIKISDYEYQAIKNFLYSETGIDLGDDKQRLVSGRLCKRLRHYDIHSYTDYFNLVLDTTHDVERQRMLDLLTTNETYFFREKAHFEFLRTKILPRHPPGEIFRVWSAASSSGEEAYSLAMELAECLGLAPWQIIGSDISSEVLSAARNGLYNIDRAKDIPEEYLEKYCFRGKGRYEGQLLVNPHFSERVSFQQINLIQPLPEMGPFDVVFLRNVVIYFNIETTINVIRQVATVLKQDGHLMIGHSESLHGLNLESTLKSVAPTVYQRV